MAELLSPAGSYESLCAAVNAGADAVYIGGSMFGARAYADNPDEEQLIRGIKFCHLHGVKLYLTVNTLLKEHEIQKLLYPYLLPYYENGVDGLIVQDLGVVRFVQEHFPGLAVHASTQMTITGVDGARFLQEHGISRVVPARELSLSEIRSIIEETGIEVETFIHGAMCYSYSGQCLFSSMLGGRSGNRGRCAQPCRLPYSCQDSGKMYSGYLLSMKDMCMLDHLPELVHAGIASFKIEGRMKRPEYTAGVVSIYRKYLDLVQEAPKSAYHVLEEDRRVLMDLYNRGGFSAGYYTQHNGPTMMAFERPNHLGTEAARIRKSAGGKITAAALEPLHRQDILELPDGSEQTLSRDISEGEPLELSYRGRAAGRGAIIYRTKNEQLLEKLRMQYMQENQKVKIKGDLRIFRERPAILKLWCSRADVTLEAQIAEEAVSSAATNESVRRQMSKTGNTPFAFEELKIHVDDGLFVPVGRLNELRREGLHRLEQTILKNAGHNGIVQTFGEPGQESAARYGREQTAGNEAEQVSVRKKTFCGSLNVLVTTLEQLDAVLAQEFCCMDTLYFDSLLCGSGERTDGVFLQLKDRMELARQKNIRCFLSFPPVFRKKERALFEQDGMQWLLDRMDGFLLNTVDELAWIKTRIPDRSHVIFAADDNFYAYNTTAAEVLRSEGISRFTFPAELHVKELTALSREHTELIVYGYQPLMQSAQCVTKNTRGCTGKTSVRFLKDRKHMEFPVLNRCNVCCNTIFNAVPLQLVTCRDEICRLAPSWLRLSFTVENGAQTNQILKQYSSVFLEGKEDTANVSDGTRGHFKRGVE